MRFHDPSMPMVWQVPSVQYEARYPNVQASRRFLWVAALVTICGLWTGLSSDVAAADKSSSRYFEQLRQRRLFSLATGYCLSRLSDGGLSAGERADLTLELSRTHARHALYKAGDEQADLWRRAEDVISRFLVDEPDNPRRMLLEVQRSLVAADHGRYLREEVQLNPHDENLVSTARSVLQRGIDELTETESSLSGRIRESRNVEPAAPDSPRLYELRSLLLEVQLRLGEAHIDRAYVLPEESADRDVALSEAEDCVKRLTSGMPEEPVTWKSRLLVAECRLARGELQRVSQLLDSVERADPPVEVRDGLLVGRVRLLLKQGNPADAAQRLLDDRRTRNRPLFGELRLLNLQVLIRLWEVAAERNQSALADELWERITDDVLRTERELGGYWSERCRILLERTRDSREYGPDVAMLLESARISYRNGHINDAIREYGDAATKAFLNGKPEAAMEFGYTDGSLQLKSGAYRDAAETFAELSERFPNNPRAASAHLLSAYALGNVYAQERTDSSRALYRQALESHRRRYAGDPTSMEATWMLARLSESHAEYRAALALYEEIPADHKHGEESQTAIARCYERALEALRANGEPTGALENEAVARIERIVSQFPGPPQALDRNHADVLLSLSRILLNQKPAKFGRADALLARVIESHRVEAQLDETERSAWKGVIRSATQLRIITLAGQKRFRQAESLLMALSDAGPGELLSILDGLAELGRNVDAAFEEDLGELQLKAAESLGSRRGELSPLQLNRLDYCLAEAYAATRQPRQAVKVYESLLEESPNDKSLMQTLADQLFKCGSPACLAKAKLNWRTLESSEKPGSRAWLDARLHVARCALALRQYDECNKLLGVTRLLYPELGGQDLQEKFQQLERELRQRERLGSRR